MAKEKVKSKMSDEQLLKHAQDRFNVAKNWVDEKITKRRKTDNDLYNSVFSTDEKAKSDVLLGQGRLFIPKTYAHTQRILVDLLEAFFFDPEEIVSISNWKNIPSETREIVKTLLNYRLNGHPINFYQEAYEFCLDAIKNKAGIFKVYPDIKLSKAKDEAGSETESISYFAPKFECIPYEDVFFDPQATWKDYWKFPIVHRMVKTLDYLKRKGYKNLDEIETITHLNAVDEIKSQRGESSGSPFVDESSLVKNAGRVYLYEVWTFLDVNNDGLLESCVYLCAGNEASISRVISDVAENTLPYQVEGEEYNRPPFVLGNAYPEPHQLFGKSLPEQVEGLQRETNSLRNQRREAVALALRKPLLINRGAGIDLLSAVNRRIGAVVLGDDISQSSVREMESHDVTASSYQEQSRTDQDFYETTSIPPDMLGMPSGSDQTATAVTAHAANANKKISLTIKNLGYAFVQAFQMLLRLEQEYESDEFIALVTGRKLGWMLPSDGLPPKEFIKGDFELMANTGINKQSQLNKWMMLMDRSLQSMPNLTQMLMSGVVDSKTIQFPNPTAYLKKIHSLLGEKNYEEFVIQALPPAPVAEPKGVASQTGLPMNLDAQTSNMNPTGVQGNG